MKRSADHQMLLARRAEAEQKFARTKDLRDLTEVMRASDSTRSVAQAGVQEKVERKGVPIGQRWE